MKGFNRVHNNHETTKIIIDPNVVYNAKVTTSKGAFTIELKQGETPKTVNNFVYLASKDFIKTRFFIE